MTYRTPDDVKEEFRTHPRRALILTTVDHESRAVKAHLTNPEILIGEKGAFYEYGCFFSGNLFDRICVSVESVFG